MEIKVIKESGESDCGERFLFFEAAPQNK